MTKFKLSTLFFVALFLLFSVALANAAPGPHPVWNGSAIGGYLVTCNYANTPCTACDALKVGVNLINFGSIIIFPIVTVIAIYGGIQMILSAGSEERFRSGKNTLVSGIVGLAIVLLAWILINTFIHFIAGNPFDWSSITC